MNYYQARQIQTTGKWHFTRERDGQITPVGYCADKCDGHGSPDDAAEHYRQYLLDTANYDVFQTEYPRACAICRQFTRKLVRTSSGSSQSFMLCSRHANRDGLSRVLKRPGIVIAS